MKEIEVNGEKYVLKEDYDSLEREKFTGARYADINPLFADEVNVMGMGSWELQGGDFIATKISTEYLERAVKILKNMSVDKKGLPSISLVWAKDHPLMIGLLDKEYNKMAGLIICPRIDGN